MYIVGVITGVITLYNTFIRTIDTLEESNACCVSCGSLVEVALGDGDEVGVYGGHDSDEGGLSSES